MANRRKETTEIAARYGFTLVRRTGTGHYVFRREGHHGQVVTGGTPSDWRSLKNFEAHLRRLIKDQEAE